MLNVVARGTLLLLSINLFFYISLPQPFTSIRPDLCIW